MPMKKRKISFLKLNANEKSIHYFEKSNANGSKNKDNGFTFFFNLKKK